MARAIDADELEKKFGYGPNDTEEERAFNQAARKIIREMLTLTPPTEWVSVKDAVPDPGERVLATDGIFVGEAYRSSANSWFRHTGFPWMDGVTGRTVRFWMPMPSSPDRRPPEGEA